MTGEKWVILAVMLVICLLYRLREQKAPGILFVFAGVCHNTLSWLLQLKLVDPSSILRHVNLRLVQASRISRPVLLFIWSRDLPKRYLWGKPQHHHF